MRLINITDLTLVEFSDARTRPRYAILSHRWSTDGETTFQDFVGPGKRSTKGFNKVAAFCDLLLRHSKSRLLDASEVHWCWIDTCCIDKRSSAELSEAVNSMARWYAEAEFTVAYLQDVSASAQTCSTLLTEQGRPSEWFSRGWTLQELLFSDKLVFCDRSWTIMPGLEKTSAEGSAGISRITRIPAECLQNPWNIGQYCIADRMSWAAERETTRVEDEAYCLLGLFGINMPLLYGEGARAFFRLQKEIIDRYEDETIFAWLDREPKEVVPSMQYSRPKAMPILAPHPSWFVYKKRLSTARKSLEVREPYRLTNRGLELDACAVMFKPYRGDQAPADSYLEDELLVIQLNCSAKFDEWKRNGIRQGHGVSQGWPICLRKIVTTHGITTYARVLCWATGRLLWKHLEEYLKQSPDCQVSKVPRQRYYVAASIEQMRSLIPRQSARTDRTDEMAYTLDMLLQKATLRRRMM